MDNHKTIAYTDTLLGNVCLKKSVSAKRISIRISPTKGIIVTIPLFATYENGIEFLNCKQDWAYKALIKCRDKMEASGLIRDGEKISEEELEDLISFLRKEAKEKLPHRLKALADRHGFKYNRVCIKHNSSNWGSCSRRGNINLNLNIIRLPEDLQDYIILHELCHLKFMNHGEKFRLLLEKLCLETIGPERNSRSLERELKKYIII